MRTLRSLGLSAAAVLTAVAAGCGMNADTTGPRSSGATQNTYPGGERSAPPAATQQTPAASPWQVAKGRLVLVATATSPMTPGPYRSFAVTLEGVEVREAEGWVAAATTRDLAALNQRRAEPLDLAAAKGPALLAVATPPAGALQGLRLRFKSGSWAAADAPKQRRPLALPKDEVIELPLQNVAMEAGRTTVVALSVDLTKVGPTKVALERGARRIAPAMFAVADASKMVGSITGTAAPPAALARVWACWADTATPIAWADADAESGTFTIAGLPAGRYFLRVTAGGYAPFEDRAAACQVIAGAATAAAPITLARR